MIGNSQRQKLTSTVQIGDYSKSVYQLNKQKFLRTTRLADEDYPIEIFESERYECLYILTKNGYFHIYDTPSGTCLFLHQISFSPIVNCHLMADQGSVLIANQKVELQQKTTELTQTLGYNKTSLSQ